MAELRFKGKDDKKMCVKLAVGMKPALVGRTGKVPILLPNSSVSRKHCEIREEKGAFVIEDLKSANGTRVNGEKLTKPRVLVAGDHIQCGEVSMYFEVPGAKKAKAPAKSSTKKAPTAAKPAAKKAPAKSAKDTAKAKAAALSKAEARIGAASKGKKKAEAPQEPANEVSKTPPANVSPKSSTAKKGPVSEAKASSPPARGSSADVESLKRENKELEDRSVRYSMQLESVTEKYKQVRDELSLLKERLEEERTTNSEHEDAREDSERSVRKLTEELESLRTGQADRDKQFRELKIKVTERERIIQQLREDNAELEYEKNEALSEAARIQNTFNRDAAESNRMEEKLEQLRQVIRDKENLVTELEAGLEEKERELITARLGEGGGDADEERNSLMADFYRKSTELDAARSERDAAQTEVAELKEDLKVLRRENDGLLSANMELENQVSEAPEGGAEGGAPDWEPILDSIASLRTGVDALSASHKAVAAAIAGAMKGAGKDKELIQKLGLEELKGLAGEMAGAQKSLSREVTALKKDIEKAQTTGGGK